MFVEFTESGAQTPLRIAVQHIVAYRPWKHIPDEPEGTAITTPGGTFYVNDAYGSVNLMVQQAILDQARAFAEVIQ